MIRLGLTGSIGMGKSTTAAMFREAGFPVYDADRAVHDLYQPRGNAVAPLVEAFGSAILDAQGGVDRQSLSAAVVGKPEALDRLNAIVHPLVAEAQRQFDTKAKRSGASLVVYDIPLLFEGGSDRLMSAVAVVAATKQIQLARVRSRPGMTEAKLSALLSRQMSDSEKLKRADFVIETSFGLAYARAQVAALTEALLARD